MKVVCQGQNYNCEIRACGKNLTVFSVGTKIEERIKLLVNIQQ